MFHDVQVFVFLKMFWNNGDIYIPHRRQLGFDQVWWSLRFDEVWPKLRFAQVWLNLRFDQVWANLRFDQVSSNFERLVV